MCAAAQSPTRLSFFVARCGENTGMPCADSNTICARRHVSTDPVPLRTIRSNKVSGTRALGEGRHDVTFADGSTVVTSLLVGADGAWSRVRPLLSDATPEYVGTSFVETNLSDADTRHPAAAKAVGGGSMIAPAPGKEIFAPRESGDTLHAYVALSKPQDWFAAKQHSPGHAQDDYRPGPIGDLRLDRADSCSDDGSTPSPRGGTRRCSRGESLFK
ncbi:hypothetical protein Sgleb_71400 [Streptomyces glebosus]|uniref:FAD-binding domain-containing protein n=1 Tax=Streptomyces glebosus TaxID=249580 RepID=A0A640T5V7_9ACTN|nr:hypothetical protein Sgleb_71400 [Streptomyces glebosus]GHG48001.1 hypothetical protein GCM10010513_04610 [Streptomyces glebosus]